jgi:hypothetical protein
MKCSILMKKLAKYFADYGDIFKKHPFLNLTDTCRQYTWTRLYFTELYEYLKILWFVTTIY